VITREDILAMGFALSREHGETVIESRGTTHRIVFAVDRVRQEPRLEHTTRPSLKNGRRGDGSRKRARARESRVELNAMTPRQLLDFVEEKLYSMISTCRVSRYWARATGDGAGIGTDRCVSQLVEARTGLAAPRGDVGGNCFPRGSLRRSVGVAKVHLFQALAPSQPEMPPTTKMD